MKPWFSALFLLTALTFLDCSTAAWKNPEVQPSATPSPLLSPLPSASPSPSSEPSTLPSASPLPKPSDEPSSSPGSQPSPSPSSTGRPPGHVGFNCVECTPAEVVKVAAAEKIVNELVPDPFFSEFLLPRGMIWTNNLTDAQVVQTIQIAQLTVPVHYYRGKCSTVGYRNVGAPDIYFNRCSHDSYDALDTASNGLHEWSHSLGYDHPVSRTSNRGLTVPYSMNAVVEAWGARPVAKVLDFNAARAKKLGHGYRDEIKVLTPEQVRAIR